MAPLTTSIVKNISGIEKRFSFLPPFGKLLAVNETYEVPGNIYHFFTDNRRDFDAFQRSLDNSNLELIQIPENPAGGAGHKPPVQTIQNLRDVAVAERVDKDLRLVEDTEFVYRFDATGVGADDGDLILVPTVGTGRWFKVAHITTPGAGLVPGTGNDIDVNPGNGIKIVADAVAVEPDDIAGAGLEDDGADNLRVAAAAAGAGLAGGGGAALSVNTGNGTKIVADSIAVEPADIAGAGLEDDGADNLRIAAAAAGDGLTGGAGSALAVNTGNGTKIVADAVAVEPADIAGTGLEDDGADNLRIAAAAAGDGLVGGGGSALAVNPGNAIQITGDAVTILGENSSVSVGGSGLKAAVPVTADKEQSPSNTAGDNASTGLTIANTPGGDGYVQVLVNGIAYILGDGVKTKDCYFSVDSGLTARAISAIVAGDELFWNGVIAGFDLATTDDVDFNYNVA